MPIPAPKLNGGSSAASRRVSRTRITTGQQQGRFKFAKPLETLEKRLLWSVTYDANGWTVVTPSVNSKIIYVAPTGSDSNTGLSPSAPIKTFKHAESLLVSGQPDEILLESGQVYNDAFLNWVYSGQDPQDPLLVSYYNPNPGTRSCCPLLIQARTPPDLPARSTNRRTSEPRIMWM